MKREECGEIWRFFGQADFDNIIHSTSPTALHIPVMELGVIASVYPIADQVSGVVGPCVLITHVRRTCMNGKREVRQPICAEGTQDAWKPVRSQDPSPQSRQAVTCFAG